MGPLRAVLQSPAVGTKACFEGKGQSQIYIYGGARATILAGRSPLVNGRRIYHGRLPWVGTGEPARMPLSDAYSIPVTDECGGSAER